MRKIYVMRSRIELVEGHGLALIDGTLWARCKARKSSTCAATNRPIKPGDLVYRPQGNGGNRMKRIIASHVDAGRAALNRVEGNG